MTFECSSDVSDSVLQWYNSLCVTTSQLGACTGDIIYNGEIIDSSLKSRFSVTPVNNVTRDASKHVTRDLNINTIQLTDAGVYLCAEARSGEGLTDSTSAQLIVLGKIRIL